MMSFTSSMPTDRRTVSGPAPASVFCSSDKLAVGGRGRMDDQRLGVADIGEVREQLQRLDELHAGVVAALQAEGEDSARAERRVLLLQRVVLVAGQARIEDPGDLRMRRQPLGHLLRVVAVALHAERQRLRSRSG